MASERFLNFVVAVRSRLREVSSELSDVRREVRRTDAESAEIPVETEGAAEAISELRAVREEATDEDMSVSVSVSGAGSSIASMGSVAAAARALGANDPNIAVRVRGASAAISQLMGVSTAREAASGDTELDVEVKGAATALAKLGLLRTATGLTRDRAFSLRNAFTDLRSALSNVVQRNGGLDELGSKIMPKLLGDSLSVLANFKTLRAVIHAIAVPSVFAGLGAGAGLLTSLGAAALSTADILGTSLVGAVAGVGGAAGLAAGGLGIYALAIGRAMSQNAEARASFAGLKAEMGGLFDELAAETGPVLAEFFSLLTRNFDIFESGAKLAVSNANAAFRSFMAELESPEQLQIFDSIMQGIGRNAGTAFSAASNGLLSVLNIFNTVIPVGERFLGALNRGLTSLREYTQSAEGIATLREYFQQAYNTAVRLGGVVVDLGAGLIGLFGALREGGLTGDMLSNLERLGTMFREATSAGSETRAMIVSFVQAARPILNEIWTTVGAIAAEFFRVADAVVKAKNEATGVSILVELLRGVQEAAGPIGDLLIDAFEKLGPRLAELLPELAELAEVFLTAHPALLLFLDAAIPLLQWFTDLPPGMQRTIASMVSWGIVLKQITGVGLFGLIGGIVQTRLALLALSAITGKKITLFGGLGAAIGRAAAAVGRFALAIGGALISPVGLAVAAVVGLGGGIIALAANWGAATDRMGPVGDALQRLTARFNETNNIRNIFQNGLGGLRQAFTDANGVSGLWANGLAGLKKRLTDTQGASGGVRRAFAALGPFFSGLWARIRGVTVAVWTAILAFLIGRWQSLRARTVAIFNSFKAFFGGVWQGIRAVIAARLTAIRAAILAAWNFVKARTTAIWNGIKAFFGVVWNGIKAIVGPRVAAIRAAVVAAWNFLKSRTTQIWNAVKAFFGNVWNQIKAVAGPRLAAIRAVVVAGWNFIKARTTAAWNAIKSFFTNAWNQIKAVVGPRLAAIKAAVSAAWNFVKARTTSIWNSVKAFLSGVWNTIKGIVSGAVNAVKGAISGAWNAIKSLTSGAWNAVKSAVSGAWNQIKSIVGGATSAVLNQIRSWASQLYNLGRDAIQGLINGITSMAGNAANAVGNLLRDAYNAGKDAIKSRSPSRLFQDLGITIPQGLTVAVLRGRAMVRGAMRSLMGAAEGAGRGSMPDAAISGVMRHINALRMLQKELAGVSRMYGVASRSGMPALAGASLLGGARRGPAPRASLVNPADRVESTSRIVVEFRGPGADRFSSDEMADMLASRINHRRRRG